MSSNYPPGFGSARDLDHVEGPLTEEELPAGRVEDYCPACGCELLLRQTWRQGGATITCADCGELIREEE